MFIDIDCCQRKKHNQNTYGDYFLSKRYQNRLIAVLSDGLGSGIKANILATMTATMLLKFIESETNIRKACEIVLNSLPVCQVRKISYSTFSAIDCDNDGYAKIVEEGNPQFLFIRNGEVIEPSYKVIVSKTFPDRQMHIYSIKLELGDRLIFCSDGVTQAALGSPHLKTGITREGLIEIVKDEISRNREVSSSELTKSIVRQAEYAEPDHKAKDDISAVSLYFREPRQAMIFTGPPYHQDKDNFYAQIFKSFKGKKAICGGTTANLISRELNISVKTQINLNCGKLPPISFMEGVDLVTEGVLTLTRACEYLENGETANDAAGELMKFLLDSDCITFMVGAKINQAHYDPNLPVEIEIRKNIIKRLANILENKYIKKVIVKYI